MPHGRIGDQACIARSNNCVSWRTTVGTQVLIQYQWSMKVPFINPYASGGSDERFFTGWPKVVYSIENIDTGTMQAGKAHDQNNQHANRIQPNGESIVDSKIRATYLLPYKIEAAIDFN